MNAIPTIGISLERIIMKITEIREAKKGASEANELLKDGWELLHVVPLPHAVIYVMGKREESGIKMDVKKAK